MEETQKNNLIIDNGSFYIRAGLSNEIIKKRDEKKDRLDYYTLKFCVAYPKKNNEEISKKLKGKPYFIGTNEEYEKSKIYSSEFDFEYPLIFEEKNTNYFNYDNLINIYEHIFSEFKLNSEEQNILLIQYPFEKEHNKQKLEEIIFETFNVPNFYIANRGALTLLSNEKSTGIVVDSGYNSTQIIPVFDGFQISTASLKLNCSGKDLNEYIIKEFKKSNSRESLSLFDVESFKKSAFFKENNEIGCPTPYFKGVPFKKTIKNCLEILFHPDINNSSGPGIAEGCIKSIQKCDRELHKELFSSIYLSGGNTMFKGFPERLKEEIDKLIKT